MTTARIRLLLVDDQPIFRLGLVALLHRTPHMEVVGEGSSAREAIELAVRL